MPETLTPERRASLIADLAKMYSLDPKVVDGVLQVESAGKAFGTGGLMIVRFEVHHFVGRWEVPIEVWSKLFRFGINGHYPWKDQYWRTTESEPWRKLHAPQAWHLMQAEEWAALTFARSLDDEAALKSTSMGAPQVLGKNCIQAGWPSARSMFDVWSISETAQIVGFFTFILLDGLLPFLRSEDWLRFATGYNGVGNAEAYAARLRDTVQKLRGG